MWEWIKNHIPIVTALIVVCVMVFYQYGCESKVKSLFNDNHYVTRAELEIELDRFVETANYRLLQLDQQDAVRNMILQNAVLLAQGQPLNPIGLITGFAGIYGIGSAVSNIKKRVAITKVNNGASGGTG
jgi:hypothetical protein